MTKMAIILLTTLLAFSSQSVTRMLEEDQTPPFEVKFEETFFFLEEGENFKVKPTIVVNLENLSFEDLNLEFRMDCPWYLFPTTKDYEKYCNAKFNGQFSLNFNKIKESVVLFTNYTLHYTAISHSLHYSAPEQTLVIEYFQIIKLEQQPCPSFILNSIDFFKHEKEFLILQPDVRLLCEMNEKGFTELIQYDIQSIQWRVLNHPDSNVLELYSDDRIAVLRNSSFNSTLDYYEIIIDYQFDDQWYMTNTVVYLTYSNSKFLVDSEPERIAVAFEETLVLDADNYYTSDRAYHHVVYEWHCPKEILPQDCFRFNRDGIISIDMKQKLLWGFTFDFQYNFTLLQTVSTYYSSEVHQDTFLVTFKPYNSRSKVTLCLDNHRACNISQTFIEVGNDLTQDIHLASKFPKSSYCEANYSSELSSMIKLPKELSISHQTEFLNLDRLTIPATDIHNALRTTPTLLIEFFCLISPVNQYSEQKIPQYQLETVTIQKAKGNLVAKFSSEEQELTVEQGKTLILNASSSYDEDSNSTLIFNWVCPGNMASYCRRVRGSILELTPETRFENRFNKQGTEFEVKLSISQGRRESEQIAVIVKVVEQDLDHCLEVRVRGAEEDAVSISQDAIFPIKLKVIFDAKCSHLVINQTLWESGSAFPFELDNNNQSLIIDSPAQISSILDLKVTVLYSVEITSYLYYLQKEYAFNIIPEKAGLSLEVSLEGFSDNFLVPDQQIAILSTIHSEEEEETQLGQLLEVRIEELNLTEEYECLYKKTCSFYTDYQNTDLSHIIHDFKYFSIEFRVKAWHTDGRKVEKKLFYQMVDSGPYIWQNCSIQTWGDRFDIVEEIILFANCTFSDKFIFTPGSSAVVFNWNTNPPLRVKKDEQYLKIAPYQLLSLEASAFLVSLNLTLTNENTIYPRLIQLKRMFPLPRINQAPRDTKVLVSPSAGNTMFTDFTFELVGYDLKPGSFLRLRAWESAQTQHLIISKLQDTVVTTTVPRQTEKLFIDIVEGMKEGRLEYNFTTIEVSDVQLVRMPVLSARQFNLAVSSLIKRVVPINYKLIGEVQAQLQIYFDMANSFRGLNTRDPLAYAQMLFSQLTEFFKNTENHSLFYTLQERAELRSKFFITYYLLGITFQNSEVDLEQLMELMEDKFRMPETVEEVLQTEVSFSTQSKWGRYLKVFLGLEKVNPDYQQKVENAYYYLVTQTQLEGEMLELHNERTNSNISIFKINKFDFATQPKGLYKFESTLDQDNSRLSLRLSMKEVIDSQDTLQFIFVNYTKQAEVSEPDNFTLMSNIISVDLKTQHLNSYTQVWRDLPVLNLFFSISRQVQSILSSKLGYLQCVFRESEEDPWQTGDVQTSPLNDKEVLCLSPHLSSYALQYVLYPPAMNPTIHEEDNLLKNKTQDRPQVEEEQNRTDPGTKTPIGTGVIDVVYQPVVEQSAFEVMPNLQYALPLTFFFIFFLLGLMGWIMRIIDVSTPSRFYNKLTMTENIKKHSFARLAGCLFLLYNPFFNYLFKVNLYVERGLRLIMLANYFLFISAIFLVTFQSLENRYYFQEIFGLSVGVWMVILVLRPLALHFSLSFFYPRNMKNWKFLDEEEQLQLGQDRSSFTQKPSWNGPGNKDFTPINQPDDFLPSNRGSFTNREGYREQAQVDQSIRNEIYSGHRLFESSMMKLSGNKEEGMEEMKDIDSVRLDRLQGSRKISTD